MAGLALVAVDGHAQNTVKTSTLPQVDVIAVSPTSGLGVPKDQIPANVQTATDADLDRTQALDLSSYLNRAFGSVTINEVQGNPFQPDVNYRGFTASPLLGTPQGLSVYLDGVRMNQPFGDVVSWDLIPRSAISSITLMPGSNPLFGLNTLGGALAVRTKSGLTNPGTSLQVLGGSFGRRAVEFETGGSRADGLNWFVTGNRFHERGWRKASPSDVGQLFGKVGTMIGRTDVSLSAALAGNNLTGNGLQEGAALQRDYSSVYTIPDETRNRSLMLNLAATNYLSDTVTLSGNAYWRRIKTNVYNGDVNTESFTESVYQPSASERTALTAAGYSGFPTSGANAANTPFPRFRCIANGLLNEEPNEKCNGLVNRTGTNQSNYGLTGQLSAQTAWAGFNHRFLVGAAFDASRIQFNQSSQFGYINPDRSVTGISGPGTFADGSQHSENAFDSRVDLGSRSYTQSVFASDTVALTPRTHVTVAARYNHNSVKTSDAITPGGGTGSLDGNHSFSRVNPALGFTQALLPTVTLYGGVNQGSRAPTAVELGCADPQAPCRLPNSFAGDPPLKQVVSTTLEGGLRGIVGAGSLAWNVGAFRTDSRDDLQFVSDNASGAGYFKNFGRTRRQGFEAGLSARPAAGWIVGTNLSFLDATYSSSDAVGGSSNSSSNAAAAGLPGTPGSIQINPGDRIPLLPRRTLKAFAQKQFNERWRVSAEVLAFSGASARGNENGQHQPDGTYYTGAGRSAGYSVLNFGVDYRPTPKVKVFLQVNNLFDRKYNTAAQLGANGFDANGNFVARPFARNANGDYPVSNSTFYSPGAPRTAWIGVRYSF